MRQRVVFIDDDRNLLDGLRRSLSFMRREWSMSFFDQPKAAVAYLAENSPAVVVCDWKMPGMDGLQLCEALRERESVQDGAGSYIILLTGNRDVHHAVEALDRGASDYVRKPCAARELQARIHVGFRMVEAEAKLLAANQQLTELANTDSLTGLMNRLRGLEVLEHELQRVAGALQSLVVARVEIDHFKRLSETSGLVGSDHVVKTVAQRLRAVCRVYTSVVRWNPAGFLVICPHAAERHALLIGERLRQSIAQAPIIGEGGGSIEVSVSVGATVAEARSVPGLAVVLEWAERALHDATEAGRDCVRITVEAPAMA